MRGVSEACSTAHACTPSFLSLDLRSQITSDVFQRKKNKGFLCSRIVVYTGSCYISYAYIHVEARCVCVGSCVLLHRIVGHCVAYERAWSSDMVTVGCGELWASRYILVVFFSHLWLYWSASVGLLLCAAHWTITYSRTVLCSRVLINSYPPSPPSLYHAQSYSLVWMQRSLWMFWSFIGFIPTSDLSSLSASYHCLEHSSFGVV